VFATHQDAAGILDGIPDRNPDLHGWNKVEVPYCSGERRGCHTARRCKQTVTHNTQHANLLMHAGDSFSGNRRAPSVDHGHELYFR
jgi:hypothetical protein